jgi:hypothetical protein
MAGPKRKIAAMMACTVIAPGDLAERFSGYRDKRIDEAGGHADTFESGPQAFGHQNAARAERQATRHDRHRHRAVSQWSKATYWQSRTAGVISHALHRSSASVRRGRILTLEAEQRKHEKGREEYAARFAAWSKVAGMEGADAKPIMDDDGGFANMSQALRFAYALANTAGCWGEYQHPRRPDQKKASLYSLLTDREDPITPAEAAAAWLRNAHDPADPETYTARWSDHYNNRLAYERAMLENEGGTAAAVDMEPGGWIKGLQIHAVARSPVTKRVVSVKVMAPSGWSEDGPLKLRSLNIERLSEGAYRPPTDEERVAFAAATKERKAAEKAAKPPALALINPTRESAQRLQDALNVIGRARHDKRPEAKWSTYEPTAVLFMTQAQYSEASKGTYSRFETRTVHAAGDILSRRITNMYTSDGAAYDKALGAALCKVRTRSCSGFFNPNHIVVITDKPQKELPGFGPTVETALERAAG